MEKNRVPDSGNIGTSDNERVTNEVAPRFTQVGNLSRLPRSGSSGHNAVRAGLKHHPAPHWPMKNSGSGLWKAALRKPSPSGSHIAP